MRPLQDVIQEYRVLFSANCASNTAYGHWDGKIALPLTLSHQSSDGMQGRGEKKQYIFLTGSISSTSTVVPCYLLTL